MEKEYLVNDFTDQELKNLWISLDKIIFFNCYPGGKTKENFDLDDYCD
jgi:hypothetical protein